MTKNLLFILTLLISLQTHAQTYNGPESAEFDYANNRWLIANTNSHQVLARNAAGVLTVFATGLVSGPYGIEIMGDTLFCCSGGSVKGFTLSTGTQVFNLNVNATFLNGMTHDNNGNLIATDFTAKTIYKINPASNSFIQIASSLVQSPNGIIFDAANNRCVFVNWGSNAPIKAIDLSNNNVTTVITTAFTNIDGITRDGDGNYYISTWGTQKVYKYDSAFVNAPVAAVSSLNNPADIFYNVVNDTLAIPNAGNNTVTFVGFTPTSVNANVKEEKELQIYPNPCRDFCNLKFPFSTGDYQLTVINSNGKVLKNVSLSLSFDTDTYTLLLNANSLSSGFYIIEIKNATGIYRDKLIVE